ncbi:unnamed protein product [Amoebophrya sp. A120]|nr:unnamed protein product [Amoebophrya sp. A120]|eukprot:GSA120T00021083001.1
MLLEACVDCRRRFQGWYVDNEIRRAYSRRRKQTWHPETCRARTASLLLIAVSCASRSKLLAQILECKCVGLRARQFSSPRRYSIQIHSRDTLRRSFPGSGFGFRFRFWM